MKKILYSLFLLFLSQLCLAQEYQLETEIAYSPSSAAYAVERCKLDVYHPVGAKDCPVVVWFHGGGLEGGQKFIPQELKNCGYVVVGVNYRLLPKCDIADCIDDAAAAVAWTFNNIEQYGGSKDKIFVSGHSAGGYLTTMVGFNKVWLAKYGIDADNIRALIPFSGQCISHFNVRKAKGLGPLQPTIDEWAPLYFIRPDCPPTVIISGDRNLELYGRYEEQAYMWRMMKLQGHTDVTLYEIQGYDHGEMASPAFKILKDHIKRLLQK